jgi:tetraacyldisaccharide 4'-kinase
MAKLPIPAFRVETVLDGLYKGSEPVPVELLRDRKITAFAGIAKPDRFFNALESLGITPAQRIGFRDHHAYTPQDLERLGGEFQITTEKDAIKLEGMGREFLHLRISSRIPELDNLLELIKQRVTLKTPTA